MRCRNWVELIRVYNFNNSDCYLNSCIPLFDTTFHMHRSLKKKVVQNINNYHLSSIHTYSNVFTFVKNEAATRRVARETTPLTKLDASADVRAPAAEECRQRHCSSAPSVITITITITVRASRARSRRRKKLGRTRFQFTEDAFPLSA